MLITDRGFIAEASDVGQALPHKLQQSHETQQEYEDVIKWLTPIDYAIQQSDLASRRQEGTGNLLLESPEFHLWLSGQEPTLFCPGIPGVGKTVFTSIVVDRLHQSHEQDPDVGIAYIYCNFQRQREQQPIHLLVSLLKQLVQARPVLPKMVRDLYSQHHNGSTYPSFEQISRSLRFLVKSFRRIFIIIDALDECQNLPTLRRTFLSEVFHLRDFTPTSLFVTSRFERDAMELFNDSLSLEIRATENDIQTFVSQQLAQLPVFVLKNH